MFPGPISSRLIFDGLGLWIDLQEGTQRVLGIKPGERDSFVLSVLLHVLKDTEGMDRHSILRRN